MVNKSSNIHKTINHIPPQTIYKGLLMSLNLTEKNYQLIKSVNSH